MVGFIVVNQIQRAQKHGVVLTHKPNYCYGRLPDYLCEETKISLRYNTTAYVMDTGERMFRGNLIWINSQLAKYKIKYTHEIKLDFLKINLLSSKISL